MSEEAENTTTWHSAPRLRYVVPVIAVLGLLLLILALAASCSGRDNGRGLKPFRATRTPAAATASEVLALSFVDLNSNPAAYQNQRIRVTGDKVMIVPGNCRLYTGPLFLWGLIAEDLQLNSLGFAELAARLPDGLTMTVEGVWRKYNGPLGCGKEPDDGVAWYLQVERIISPNPLPLDAIPFATIQVLLGTRTGIEITPFAPPIGETAVTTQPGIGITPLATDSAFPISTPLPSGTLLPTATLDPAFTTITPQPGLTPSPTPQTNPTRPGDATATATLPGIPGGTPSPTVPGLITQTPPPGGYPNPSTPIPSSTPY